MNYKPYSMEWNRRRYLSDAIKSYFNDEVEPNIIVDDIQIDLLGNPDLSKKFIMDEILNV